MGALFTSIKRCDVGISPNSSKPARAGSDPRGTQAFGASLAGPGSTLLSGASVFATRTSD